MKSIDWFVPAARQALMGIGLSCLLVAAPAAAEPALEGFDAYIEQARAELENVGVAVAVVRNDRVIFSQGFGIKQHGLPDKVGPDTLFQIGSTSKAFTTAALAILVEEGKIGWDDPVVDHLPGFRLQDPWLTRHLTVRDTVTHRSGIEDTAHFVFRVMDTDAAVDQLRHIPARHAFRDSAEYSNLMYAVAGKVISTVSGQSWHRFVEQRLLAPLQMRRSGTTPYGFWDARFVTPTFWGSAAAGRYSHKDARDADVAMPHFLDRQGVPTVIAWQSYDNAAAAGSVVSSVNEMANWLALHLNEGRFAGQQLLKPETVKELHAVQNLRYRSDFPFDGATEGYAMGWRRERHHGRPLLWHSGGILGFPAYVAMIPEEKIGVVVLANSVKQVAGYRYALNAAIALRAFDQLLGAPPREWSREFAARARQAESDARAQEQKLQASRIANAPPSLPLEQYVGDYEDQALDSGPVRVRLENGRLTLSFDGEGAFSGFLDPWHHDVFRLRLKVPSDLGQFPRFDIGPAGKIVSLSLFDSAYQRLPTENAP